MVNERIRRECLKKPVFLLAFLLAFQISFNVEATTKVEVEPNITGVESEISTINDEKIIFKETKHSAKELVKLRKDVIKTINNYYIHY
ncbi:hypothetical protein [Bacillus sp. FJAT-52991]|uniref:Uncharacterized protein n=1 Tax=Bacillus kandeliae TaxID=3129297 RepID=A0ABZ2NC27_9BACI